MLLYDPNSRGSRIVKNILSAIVTLAVIVSAANFVQNTTSNTYQDLEPQMTTMQGIRQTAQDSVTFAQSMENPDQYAAQIENVQQYMSDYDYFTKLPAYRYLTATSLPDRVLSMFHHKDQQHLVDSMQTTAHNLDTQTKELLDAVDKTMADDFTQHAGQWLLQVDDPTQVNELIDRYGSPPRSVQGLVDVSLVRVTAARVGIAEIVQRGDQLILYSDIVGPKQLDKVMEQYPHRVLYNAIGRPYFSLRVQKGESPLVLLRDVVTLLPGA